MQTILRQTIQPGHLTVYDKQAEGSLSSVQMRLRLFICIIMMQNFQTVVFHHISVTVTGFHCAGQRAYAPFVRVLFVKMIDVYYG